MLLTYNRLVELIKEGVIENVPEENINGASIDLTLANTIQVEHITKAASIIDLKYKENIQTRELVLEDGEFFDLWPGDFILAATREVFHIPNNIAGEFKLKSSAARNGLDHHLAGWADPRFNGAVLTLELKNNTRGHVLRLRPGMKIGQIVLWQGEPVPEHASYAVKGQYNGDRKATASKGIR